MENPQEYYTNRLTLFTRQYAAVRKTLVTLSVFRLLSFLTIFFFMYQFWGRLLIMVPCVVVSGAVFLSFVLRYNRFKYKKNWIQQRININQTELKVLQKDFFSLPDGKEYSNSGHDYSHDIDLFGKGSFFQYSNRTTTEAGKELLATIYCKNTVQNIPEKQKAIQELANKIEWRQDYSTTATLIKTETSVRTITKWLKSHQPIVKKRLVWLPYAFSVCSITLFLLVFLNLIPSTLIVYWFFLGSGISGWYLKKVNQLTENTSKVLNTFQQYHQLIAKLETQSFSSSLLKEKQQIILEDKKPTSQHIKQFSKALDALEQRANMLISIPANAFLLMDLYNTRRVEKWIEEHKDKVEDWFGVIAFFDAYNSLGNFAFNHPNYTFPSIKKNATIINAKALGHPLIDENRVVHNDLKIDKEHFFVVTGANMAGKSTFLRTVSLYIVMTNCGLPVCADSSEYSPIKLITSMRTTDSLTDDASYFYAELKRLKTIIDKIKTDTYFIVLDEILKGTNSKDKAIGSRKFIEKLSASKSTGIIATHDLSLCEVANDSNKVENYFFEAFINDKELTFDYIFKKGVCENMNASFLLKNMGIV